MIRILYHRAIHGAYKQRSASGLACNIWRRGMTARSKLSGHRPAQRGLALYAGVTRSLYAAFSTPAHIPRRL